MNDPLAAAKRLEPVILQHRRETDDTRQLPQPIVDALIRTRLCRMALPVEDGGLEVEPVHALPVYEALAAVEASVAWVAWNNALVCWMARFLGPASRRSIFGDESSLFANSTRPSGRAVREDDAYRVSGQWNLVSGCLHAQWIPLMCLIESDGQLEFERPGVPRMRMFFFPRERCEIVDTWHVGGLRGTGSHDVKLENARVTYDHSIGLTDESLLDSAFGRVPIGVTMSAGCTSICLGITQAVARELLALGRTKVTPGPIPDLRDRPGNQAAVARTLTTISALRKHLHEAYGAVWQTVDEGDSPAPEVLADAWSASVTTALTCRAAVSEMYAIAGTSALYEHNPIERAHRDIHAVLQHVILQPFWLEEAGKIKLGLEATNPLFAA